jgi:hypothetical protein
MRRDQLRRVFAVVRFDRFTGLEVPIEHKFTVVRVLENAAAANQEADRLNEINKDKDSRYYVQVTRWEGSGT